MAWQQSAHLTTLRQAISLALLASVYTFATSTAAHAATIGKTSVQSAQHEPLNATIRVSDIDAESFSAGLVSADIYRQMGLQPTDSMSVRFVPTSQSTGHIYIQTAQPVTTPFADVVLAIRDRGKQQVVPKTLLMPLERSATRLDTRQQPRSRAKLNLPKASQPVGQALIVKHTAPPPLLTSRNLASLPAVDLPKLPNNTELAGYQAHGPSASIQPKLSQRDPQLDILNVQITRKVQLINNSDSEALLASTPSLTNALPPKSTDAPSPTSLENDSAPIPVESLPAERSSKVSYTVQRNDSLWSIAKELASKNQLDIKTVMQQLQAQNPDAFINHDMNRLKANAQLSLPNYEVIPSQKTLQTAIKARRARLRAAKKARSTSQTTNKAAVTAKSNKAATSNTTRANSAITTQAKSASQSTTKTLPKARMTVLAPGKNGQADGTQTKASAATGSGINTDMLATLKQSRHRAATQAARVREVNQQLADYSKKLKLQNQKLAELEAYLKKLRQQ